MTSNEHLLLDSQKEQSKSASGVQAAGIIALTLLPLAVILLQVSLPLQGMLAYSLYKPFMIIPPLLYLRQKGIRPIRDIINPERWRAGIWPGIGFGMLGGAIFLGAYLFAADLLIDKAAIMAKIGTQFSVTASTVILAALYTTFINSLIEEFFYRGFAFGLLRRKNRTLAYLLPASVFTIQHLFFIYHWMSIPVLALVAVSLFVFSLVMQRVYEKTDSLIGPWIAHMFGDAVMMGIAASMVF